MADNLKPYDPNKGFISFRLNPEAIKEELISFVPYNRTLRYLHDNPEAPISETAKIAMSETPILGSLLAGEPVDAAKEAFLFGMPIKSPNLAKKAINKLPQTTQFKPEVYGDGIHSVMAHDPVSNKNWEVYLSGQDGKLHIAPDWVDTKEFMANPQSPSNINQFNEFIDQTNIAHKLNKPRSGELEGRLSIKKVKESNPYDMFAELEPIDEEMLEAARRIKLANNRIADAARWDNVYNDVKQQIKLRPNESLVMFESNPNHAFVYNSKQNHAVDIQGRGTKSDKYRRNNWMGHIPEPGETIIPFNGNTANYFERNYNRLRNDYNAKYQFEDHYVPYENPNQYNLDRIQAEKDYFNSINGPFIEDILHKQRK